jgi:hypothetical protein
MMKYWKGCAGALALMLLCGALNLFTRAPEVNFERIQDAQSKLASLGLHVTTDGAGGQLSCGFLLSRNAATWTDVCMLRKNGAMGPEWRGRVWVTLSPSVWQLESVPERAGVRVWGSVVAFGDDELLREIEAAL